jgi:hypothetical protein
MSIPGLIYPTSKGMLAGNPRDSAIANMNNASAIQAQANNAVGGRRRRIGGGNIAVPQFQMLYEPQGGPGTNPNNQIQANAAIATQGAANASLDSGAYKKGGRRRSKKLNSRKLNSRKLKGGNSDWNWGCMSGGRKRSTRRRRSNKRRASRRRS